MFDYEKFGNELFMKIQEVIQEIMEEFPDLYAVSLDLSGSSDSVGIIANYKSYLEENVDEDDEDYMYFKYCEDEWGYFDTFEDISGLLKQELSDNSDKYTDSTTYKYTDEYAAHFDKLCKICVSVMAQYRKLMDEINNQIILTFNVREMLDAEERVSIFRCINGDEKTQEYEANIDDFC